MGTPAIVVVSQYVTVKKARKLNRDFSDYVEYINREETKKNNRLNLQLNEISKTTNDLFSEFLDYMGDDKKRGQLFSNDVNVFAKEDLKKLKSAYQLAQVNKSPMWQDVISFDNTWLEKQGMYDSKTGKLDESKMKNIVREAMNKMLEAENMKETAVWAAAVHYNTDNIHVHVATVEPFPTREKKWYKDEETGEWLQEYRGKRKQRSLDKIKSTVANRILNRTEQRIRIDEIIRGSVKHKKENVTSLSAYRKTKKLFMQALNYLPPDRRQWFYGYHSIDEARPYIDEITDIYLNTYHKKDMLELEQLLDEEVQVMKEVYGDGSKYEQYKKTKMEELRQRMGNAVLAEMRAYAKRKDDGSYKRRTNFLSGKGVFRLEGRLFNSVRRLNYHLRKTFYDYRRERLTDEFDRMLEGYER